MSIELNQNQIKELKALLASCGLEVKKTRQPRITIAGEGSPGKRPHWWHGTKSGETRKMVAKHGLLSNSRGAYEYQVKDAIGNWVSLDSPDFDSANAHRKAVNAKILGNHKGFHSGNHK